MPLGTVIGTDLPCASLPLGLWDSIDRCSQEVNGLRWQALPAPKTLPSDTADRVTLRTGSATWTDTRDEKKKKQRAQRELTLIMILIPTNCYCHRMPVTDSHEMSRGCPRSPEWPLDISSLLTKSNPARPLEALQKASVCSSAATFPIYTQWPLYWTPRVV